MVIITNHDPLLPQHSVSTPNRPARGDPTRDPPRLEASRGTARGMVFGLDTASDFDLSPGGTRQWGRHASCITLYGH